MPDTDPGRFVFVVGCPRSGTSLLATVLNGRVAIPYETHFLPLFAPVAWLWGDLDDERRRTRLLEAIYEFLEIWTARASMGRDLERLRRISLLSTRPESDQIAAQSRSYSELVAGLFERFARSRGLRLCGDKSAFFHHVPMTRLDRTMPGARFVHIIRDGRDVCLSWMKGWYGPSTVAECARVWMEHVGEKRAWGRLHPERYLELRYEDLLQEPGRELERVAHFVGFAYDDSLLDFYTSEYARVFASSGPHELMSGPLVEGNREKWRREMEPADQRFFEYVAGAVLRACGYSIEHGAMRRRDLLGFRARLLSSRLVTPVTLHRWRLRLKSALPVLLWAARGLGIPLGRLMAAGLSEPDRAAPGSG